MEAKPARETSRFWRQLGIVSPQDLANLHVVFIGAGGIGSPAVPALTKMGIMNLTAIDPDTIESHNRPNQLYKETDLGRPKVEALADICKEFSGVEIDIRQERVDETHQLSGVVISGVDSMEARQKIWKAVKHNINVPLYIEARMGAEVLRMHTLRPTDRTNIIWYEKMLDNTNLLDAPCTERSIIYTVLVCAGFIANQIKKFAKGEELKRQVCFDLKTWQIIAN